LRKGRGRSARKREQHGKRKGGLGGKLPKKRKKKKKKKKGKKGFVGPNPNRGTLGVLGASPPGFIPGKAQN